MWGAKDGKQFLKEVNSTYETVIHWKPNLFLPPYGASGKKCVQEIARLLQAYADSSSLECIAELPSYNNYYFKNHQKTPEQRITPNTF